MIAAFGVYSFSYPPNETGVSSWPFFQSSAKRSGAARRLASSVNEREPPRAPRPGGQVSETSR